MAKRMARLVSLDGLTMDMEVDRYNPPRSFVRVIPYPQPLRYVPPSEPIPMMGPMGQRTYVMDYYTSDTAVLVYQEQPSRESRGGMW